MQHIEPGLQATQPWRVPLSVDTLRRARRFARFCLVGLLGAVLNMALFYLFVRVGDLHYLLASALATEATIITNFVLNDRWTFRAAQTGTSWVGRALRYNLIALGGLAISVATLAALTHLLRFDYLAANPFAILAGVAWNYTVNARFTYAVPVYDFQSLHAVLAAHTRRAAPGLSQAVSWLVIGTAIVWIARTTPGAWITAGALLLGTAWVVRTGIDRHRAVLSLCAPVVGIAAVDYLAWRWAMINWLSWWLALPLFVAEAFGALHTLGLQYTVWPRREPVPTTRVDPTRFPVYIFIPTVNEGPAILEPTLLGAMAARDCYLTAYPDALVEIVVCNDGLVAKAPDWQATEDLAARLGVVCVTRTVPGGAKAGNIESARQRLGVTGDALLVIFDADQIAEPTFLLETVPPFADPSTGWVQTGQYYRNLDNPVARWAHDQQALFYKVLCHGKATQNAAFICGTNVVLRAAALDEIGGLPQDSVTEDFAASIELHSRWRGIFLPEMLAQGLGPMDLKSYFSQQRRWAIGTLGVLRSHWRSLLLPRRGGLRVPQRLQYALACTHYMCGVRDMIYIVVPLVFLATGIPAVRGATLPTFLWHFLPYWLASQVAFWYVSRGKTGLRGIVIGFGSFPVLVTSLLSVVLKRRVGFAVTAKRRTAASFWRSLLFQMAALLGCVCVLGWTAVTGRDNGPTRISMLWVIYSTLMLTAMLWLGLADTLPVRAALRPALNWARAGNVALRRTRRLWRPAVALAVVLAGAEVALGATQSTAQSFRFHPILVTGRPYLGVSLPYELLDTRPPVLQRQLGRSFAIVGRTQQIKDTFDRSWADRLAARGARPWITLFFGVPGNASLAASLPAITNGVDDAALHRWAARMRAYGKPIYLSVLPQVDRNWVSSSAVTNGGIPQDVPRTWAHIRSIFRQEGAANVAFVWSPADPAHDRGYAPPAASIDAVLLSLISYPNTRWADPAAAVAAVERRYPRVPLFLEVSASGPSSQKARWLRSVGAVVRKAHTVYALLYHEGSPALHATRAQDLVWSMASSPATLAAMRSAVALDTVRTTVVDESGLAEIGGHGQRTPAGALAGQHEPQQLARSVASQVEESQGLGSNLPLSRQVTLGGAMETAHAHTDLTLINPDSHPVGARLIYYFADGTRIVRTVSIHASSRKSVALGDIEPHRGAFGLVLQPNRPLAAFAILRRDGTGGDLLLIGQNAASTWDLQENYTGLTAQETLTILNPDPTRPAQVTLRLRPLVTNAEVMLHLTVPPHSLATKQLQSLQAAAVAITANHPVAVGHLPSFSAAGYRIAMSANAGATATNWIATTAGMPGKGRTVITLFSPSCAATLDSSMAARKPARTSMLVARCRAVDSLHGFINSGLHTLTGAQRTIAQGNYGGSALFGATH